MSVSRVAVRATLCAGAAAITALVVRGSIADRVASKVAPVAQRVATRAPTIVSEAPAMPVVEPLPPPSIVPSAQPLPVASTSSTPSLPSKPNAKPTAKSKTGPSHVSRAEVEEAIASKLGGATAKLARDPEGHPIGLKIAGAGTAARFGVHEGDVLVAANGYPLRSAEEGFAALGAIFPDGGKSLSKPTRVVFTFKRGDGWYSVPLEVDAP